MYQNITIFDDTAYISFYDATGVGRHNITVLARGEKNYLYGQAMKLFFAMWDAGTADPKYHQ
jgi:hypothetical protein